MQYVKESRLAAPPAAVFAFYEAPGAFERLVPPWAPVEVVEPPRSLQVGTRVILRVPVGPVKITWVAVHTAYDPPHLFADRQESGPFARWEHAHRFLDDGRGGTILRDEVELEPPLGGLGRLVAARSIRRKLDELFTYRHEQTRRWVEAGGAS